MQAQGWRRRGPWGGGGDLACGEVPKPGRGIDAMEAGTWLAGVKDWRGREGA